MGLTPIGKHMKYRVILLLAIVFIPLDSFSIAFKIGPSFISANEYTSTGNAIEINLSGTNYIKSSDKTNVSCDFSLIYGTKALEHKRTDYFFAAPFTIKVWVPLLKNKKDKFAEIFLGIGYSFLVTGISYNQIDANQYTYSGNAKVVQAGYCFGAKKHASIQYDIGCRYFLVDKPENHSEPGLGEIFLRIGVSYNQTLKEAMKND
jgi:hypothetical protein